MGLTGSCHQLSEFITRFISCHIVCTASKVEISPHGIVMPKGLYFTAVVFFLLRFFDA